MLYTYAQLKQVVKNVLNETESQRLMVQRGEERGERLQSSIQRRLQELETEIIAIVKKGCPHFKVQWFRQYHEIHWYDTSCKKGLEHCEYVWHNECPFDILEPNLEIEKLEKELWENWKKT